MGDSSTDKPQIAGLGSSNNVFQEQNTDEIEHTSEKSNETPSTSSVPTPVVLPSAQDNLLTREKILQKYSSSDPDGPLDITCTTNSKPGKRLKRSSKSSGKKDKCPCQTSDTTSWKPKCCKCHQTWHSACCNLKGISSIVELENWECPWCYIPLFNDPTKPKAVTNVLREIQLDIDSINNKYDNFNVDDLNNQISELKQCLNDISVSNVTSDNVNKLHNDLVNSITFELKNIVDSQNLFVTNELAKFKESIQECKTKQPDTTGSQPDMSSFPGKHFDHHKSGFLEEDGKDGLKQFVTENDEEFVKVGNRDVLYFGDFSYKYGNVEHNAAPMPDVLKQVIEKIHDNFSPSEKINSCLITKYTDGSSVCPPHSDNEPFINPASDIFTLSMGANRNMKFNNIGKYSCAVNESILLKDNDLLVFSRLSQDFFNHSIVPDESSNECRYSFTFRCLAPYNLNYTKIIGDSNTQELVFGNDRGKLGRWLPGSLIKASKIANIPDPYSIGPCRNAVIHVGINDIQVTNPKSPQFLCNLLEDKLRSILSVYPKMKIFLSLLLPTKDSNLNYRVNELNNCFKQLAANLGNVDTIEHFNLVDESGFLNPSFGRFKRGLPNSNDLIHLGNSGIKRFVLNIKSKIMYKKSPNGRTQPSLNRASQLPLPRSTSPWQQWSSGCPPTTSSLPPSSQNPTFLGTPSPSPFPASLSVVGNHQFSNTMYQSSFPSIAADGCQF